LNRPAEPLPELDVVAGAHAAVAVEVEGGVDAAEEQAEDDEVIGGDRAVAGDFAKQVCRHCRPDSPPPPATSRSPSHCKPDSRSNGNPAKASVGDDFPTRPVTPAPQIYMGAVS